MRYKNNVLDRLNQVDAIVSRINLQINRSMAQDQILESVEQLKEVIEFVTYFFLKVASKLRC